MVGAASGPAAFATTHWSVVLQAHGDDSEARVAMAELARAYWQPLYAFARRRGHPAEDARDLVQAFFVRLIETDGLAGARRERGRFRSYLLGAFRHHLGHHRERAAAQKRGGGVEVLSLDVEAAESTYRLAAVDERTPERLYERRWALTLLERTLGRLRREWTAAGRAEAFEELKGCLTGELCEPRRRARRLGMKEGALRVAVHRLRRRFGTLVRLEIAATVEDAGEVDDELRHLLAVLRESP